MPEYENLSVLDCRVNDFRIPAASTLSWKSIPGGRGMGALLYNFQTFPTCSYRKNAPY